jgi:hypothetical protein
MWLRVIHDRTWAFSTVPSSAYQQDTPGSISRVPASCEFYLLRAYLKNRDKYPMSEMDELIRLQARRVLSTAFTDGDEDDRAEARKLAWRHLRPGDRRIFQFFDKMPGLYRRLNCIRRWILKPRLLRRVPQDER